jgi:hypothetical protein
MLFILRLATDNWLLFCPFRAIHFLARNLGLKPQAARKSRSAAPTSVSIADID